MPRSGARRNPRESGVESVFMVCLHFGSLRVRSISQLKRWAKQLLPLLLLGVGEDGLDLPCVVLADLLDLRSDLLRVAAGLGLLDQRLDLLLQLLHDAP